jgi:hypothetical protein
MYMYQVGLNRTNDVCSGLMIINVDRFHDFWKVLKTVPMYRMPYDNLIGDQRMLYLVREKNRTLVGDLPPAWHVHLAHGFRRKEPHSLYRNRTGVGMVHFNGLRSSEQHYWDGQGGVLWYCKESPEYRTNRENWEEF